MSLQHFEHTLLVPGVLALLGLVLLTVFELKIQHCEAKRLFCDWLHSARF